MKYDASKLYSYPERLAKEMEFTYWNASMVTLHPITFINYKDTENSLFHKSLVFVSEVLQHKAAMVSAIAMEPKIMYRT